MSRQRQVRGVPYEAITTRRHQTTTSRRHKTTNRKSRTTRRCARELVFSRTRRASRFTPVPRLPGPQVDHCDEYDVRLSLSASEEARIIAAARRCGIEPSAFVRASALLEATRVLAQTPSIDASIIEPARCAEAIQGVFPPGRRLKKAPLRTSKLSRLIG